MAITLQQLRYLIAVADNGSLTAAASAVGVTQPVLSRALATLQVELGAPLLKRRDRSLVPTPAGMAALRSARRAVAAAEDVRRAALRKHAPPLLRIAAGTTVASLLAPAVRQILEQRPDMHVEIVHAENPLSRAQILLDDQADLALGDKPPPGAGLEWRSLAWLELALVSAIDTDLPEPVPMEMMAEIPQITMPAGAREAPFDDTFLNAGVNPHIVLEAADISIYLPMAQAGVGSFMGFRFCCEDIPRVRVRSFDPPQHVEVGFAFTAAKRRQIREFIDITVSSVRSLGL